MADTDAIWKALSNPVRRSMLDTLRDGPRSTGEMAGRYPELSRFAVMQHLGVLEAANLVLVRREGRRRLNFVNPVPLRELYERWVSAHASGVAETTLAMKRYAEGEREEILRLDDNAGKMVKVEAEARLNASQEKVFAALTTELGNWWPHRYKPGSKVVMEPWVGGRCFEDWGDGKGALYGTLVYYDPPHTLVSFGGSSLTKGFTAYDVQSVQPDGDACIYKKSLTMWGDVSEETEKKFREGTRAFLEQALRAYVERGIGYTEKGEKK